MAHLNIEIKARSKKSNKQYQTLLHLGAKDLGVDHQTDTYFEVPQGRLKLRQGNIENSLIFYQRQNSEGPKASDVHLSRLPNDTDLRPVLLAALGEKITVRKARRILFIDHVKFHIDQVEGLGDFVEIEVIDKDRSIKTSDLQDLCEHYIQLLEIEEQDLVAESYSDLLALGGPAAL